MDLITLDVRSGVENVTANIEFGTLCPEETCSKIGTLEVKGGGEWSVEVFSDGEPIQGHMSEYDPVECEYIGESGRQLADPLKIQAYDQQGAFVGEVDLERGGAIIQGGGNGPEFYTLYFNQTVWWCDEPLSQGHIYRIVVTFSFE